MDEVPASARPRRADVVAAYALGVEPYEQLWGPVILPAAAALVPFLGLGREGVVLDVGAGTGALTPAIRSAAPEALVISVDATWEMLRVAHVKRATAAVQADAQALPVAPESVDAVVLAYVLFHLSEPHRALREAARVLRPGGRVGTVTWQSERPERAQLLWNDALAEAGIPPLKPRRMDAGLDGPQAIGRLLRAAGFTPERIWSETLRRQWDRGSFWALLTGMGANRQRLGLIDREARPALLAGVREQLDRLGPEDFLWEGTVVCSVGFKRDPTAR